MKKYLLLNALTLSEWDGVSFALVELTDEREKFIKEKIERAKVLLKEEGINSFSIYADNAEFYNDVEQLPEEVFKVEIASNCFNQIISLDDKVVEGFTRPEQTLKYGEMAFTESGVVFKSSGKHTSEEYWTDNFKF